MAKELCEILQSFGFTQYEAKAYIALVGIGPSTPPNISRISGIPRARIYDTLESLIKKGIVMTEGTTDGATTYASLPVNVFLESVRENWTTDFSFAEKELRAIEKQEAKQSLSLTTLRGEDNILAFCRILIRRAKKQITLSIWETMYEKLLPELKQASQNGCRIKGITFEVSEPLPGLCNHRTNEYMASLRADNWFILSVDSRELLYGHSSELDGSAFYTDDAVHIYILEDYIWHDVIVNRLVLEQGQQLDGWILPEMEEFFGRKMLSEEFHKKG